MLRAIIIFGALAGSSYGKEYQCTSNKESVMMFGGSFNGKRNLNIVTVMGECTASNTDMTSGAMGLGVAVLGQQIYLCGGYDGKSNGRSECYIRERNGTEKPGPSLYQGRSLFTLNTVGSKLVAVGGFNGREYLDSVEVLEPGSTWKTQDYKINPARYSHCAVTISSKSVMLVGGSSGAHTRTEELNIETGNVTIYSDYPVPVYYHACTLFQNKIISTGGYYNKGSYSNKVFTLDFKTAGSAWVEGPDMKYTRGLHSIVVLNGIPTVFSGKGTGEYTMEELIQGKWAESPFSFKREHYGAVVTPWCTHCEGQENQCSSNKESVMFFGGRWNSNNVTVMGECTASNTDMKRGADGLGVAVLGQQIYLCGGGYNRGSECYIRERNGTEKPGPSLNQGRSYFTLNTVGSKLVAVGGSDDRGYLDSVEELEPGSTWITQGKNRINPARYRHCAVTISSKSVMLVGGFGKGILKLTEELNIETGNVTPYPDYPGPVYHHACALFQNKIISTGGKYKGSYSNKVFTLDFRTAGSAWVEGPNMKYIRYYHSMIVLNGIPTVYSGQGTGRYTMEELIQGKWSVSSLSFTRENFGAVVTPWCTHCEERLTELQYSEITRVPALPKTLEPKGQQNGARGTREQITANVVVLFGGRVNNNTFSATVEAVGTCNGTNTEDLNTGRQAASAAVFGQQIYICGGDLTGRIYTNSCYIRESTGTGQIAGPSMNSERTLFTLNTVGSKLVAFGGREGTTYLDTIEVLEPKSGPGAKWKMQNYTVTPGRDNHCAVTVGSDSLMLIGGHNYPLGGDMKTTQLLNITTGNVTQYPDLPETLVWHACSLYQNQIISTGGHVATRRSNRVFLLDLSLKKWSDGPSMLRMRSWHAMGVVNGFPTVYSGDGDGYAFLEVLVNGQWHERPFSKRSGAASVVLVQSC